MDLPRSWLLVALGAAYAAAAAGAAAAAQAATAVFANAPLAAVFSNAPLVAAAGAAAATVALFVAWACVATCVNACGAQTREEPLLEPRWISTPPSPTDKSLQLEATLQRQRRWRECFCGHSAEATAAAANAAQRRPPSSSTRGGSCRELAWPQDITWTADVTPAERERVDCLLGRFPGSRPAHLLRFLRAKPHAVGEAARMYEEHLTWRRCAGAPERLLEASRAVAPNFVRTHGVTLDGSPIVFFQGACYRGEIAPELYTLAVAHFVDMAMGRGDSSRQVTVLVDTRPNPGWPNKSAFTMVPFIRNCVAVISANYPGCPERVIVYPVPAFVKHLVNFVLTFVDRETRRKLVIMSGSDALGAECPAELAHYVALDQLPPDAHARHAALHTQRTEEDTWVGGTITDAAASLHRTMASQIAVPAED